MENDPAKERKIVSSKLKLNQDFIKKAGAETSIELQAAVCPL